MGLDSVELIISFEQYFGIEIPDKAAEQMYSIENVVAFFVDKLNLKDEMSVSNLTRMQTLKQCFNIELENIMFDHYPIENKDFWQKVTQDTNLKMYLPPKPKSKNAKLSKVLHFNPMYDWKTITFKRFLEVTAFANYESIVAQKEITNKAEVFVVVAGLTFKKNGLDPYEVFMNSKFVDDLGID